MVVTNHFLSGTYAGIFKLNGGFGVDIFFVLSGFLMIHTLRPEKTPLNFFFSRVRRIYPLYIILSLPLILTTIALKDNYFFIGNILLLPGFGFEKYHMANGPAWTLVYEMIFYSIFTIALIFSKNKIITCAFVCIVIFICVYSISGHARMGWVNIGYILGDALMINFALGCILGCIYPMMKDRISIRFMVFFAIFILICYIALDTLSSYDRFFKFGIPALIIVLLATITQSGSGFVYNIFHKIGDASYSIYLSHIYITFIYHDFVKVNGNNWVISQYSSIAFAVASVIFGLFIHLAIEKTIDSRLRMINKNNNRVRILS